MDSPWHCELPNCAGPKTSNPGLPHAKSFAGPGWVTDRTKILMCNRCKVKCVLKYKINGKFMYMVKDPGADEDQLRHSFEERLGSMEVDTRKLAGHCLNCDSPDHHTNDCLEEFVPGEQPEYDE